MGIEQIKDKIIDSANQEARRIFDKGLTENRAKVHAARRVAASDVETARNSAEKDAETIRLRRESAGNLEAKKMRLAAKQEAISASFAAAEKKLSELPKEEYIAFLKKKLAEIGASGGELAFNAKDRESIGEALVSELNSGGGKFTLSEEILDASGGFVLRMGAVEVDLSFGMLLKTIRQEVTPEVVEVLFG